MTAPDRREWAAGEFYAHRISYSQQELLDYHRQISDALLGGGPKNTPPQIEIEGTGHRVVMINIDRLRAQVRIEVTGGADRDGTWASSVPDSIPADSYYFDEVPGASWGSWREGR